MGRFFRSHVISCIIALVVSLSLAESSFAQKVLLDVTPQDSFVRLSFKGVDGKPRIDEKKGTATVHFPAGTSMDAAPDLEGLPGYIKNITFSDDPDKGLIFHIQTVNNIKIRSFNVKNAMILDVVRPPGFKEVKKAPPEKIEKETDQGKDVGGKEAQDKEAQPSAPGEQPATGAVPDPPILPAAEKEKKNEIKKKPLYFKITAHRQVGHIDPYIEFPWDEKVGLAMIQKGRSLWIVFDKKQKIILPSTSAQKRVGFESLEIHEDPEFSVLKGELMPRMLAHAISKKNGWIIQLRGENLLLRKKMKISLEQEEQKRLLKLHVMEKVKPYVTQDPFTGHKMTLFPLKSEAVGVSHLHHTPDFNLLTVSQGIVVDHLAQDLSLKTVGMDILISRPEGLLISESDERQFTAKQQKISPIMNWEIANSTTDLGKREQFTIQMSRMPVQKRAAWRYEYARTLLVNRDYREAIGQIELALLERPQLKNDLRFIALLGILYRLDGTYQKSRELFRKYPLPDDEFSPWRGIILLEAEHNAKAAYEAFEQGSHYINAYPVIVRNFVLLKAAEAAMLERKSPKAFLARVDKRFLTDSQSELKDFFDIQYEMDIRVDGEDDDDDLISSAGPQSSLEVKLKALLEKAKTPRVKTLAGLKQIGYSKDSPAEKIATLESRKLHVTEGYPRNLFFKQLLVFYREIDDKPGILDTLEDMIVESRSIVEKERLIQEAQNTFTDFFVKNKGEGTTPESQVVFFDRFKRFLPRGEKRVEAILYIADQFRRMDLINNAARLLRSVLPFLKDKALRSRVQFGLAEMAFEEEKYGRMDFYLNNIMLQDAYKKRISLLRVEALIRQGKYFEAFELLRGSGNQAALEVVSKVMLQRRFWYPLLAVSDRYVNSEGGGGVLSPGVLRAVSLFEYHGYDVLRQEKNRLRGMYNSKKEKKGVDVLSVGRVKEGLTNREQLVNTIEHAKDFEKGVRDYLKASDKFTARRAKSRKASIQASHLDILDTSAGK